MVCGCSTRARLRRRRGYGEPGAVERIRRERKPDDRLFQDEDDELQRRVQHATDRGTSAHAAWPAGGPLPAPSARCRRCHRRGGVEGGENENGGRERRASARAAQDQRRDRTLRAAAARAPLFRRCRQDPAQCGWQASVGAFVRRGETAAHRQLERRRGHSGC